MGNFFDSLLKKIDDFLFELLGLILPALLFVLILFQPLIYGGFDRNKLIDNFDLVFNFVSKINNFWIVIVAIFIFYTFGNVIKVFSKIYYELGISVFDNTIFRVFKLFYSLIVKLIMKISKNKFSEKKLKKSMKNMFFLSIISCIHKWLKNSISFRYDNYGYDFKDLYIDLANNKLKINNFDIESPDKTWYAFYKTATNILDNNNIKNMYHKFLAKYNSFRSIEVIFVFAILYNFIFQSRLTNIDMTMFNAVFCFNIFCVISFHEKFKRYWMLCGNEVISGLRTYYFERTNDDDKK